MAATCSRIGQTREEPTELRRTRIDSVASPESATNPNCLHQLDTEKQLLTDRKQREQNMSPELQRDLCKNGMEEGEQVLPSCKHLEPNSNFYNQSCEQQRRLNRTGIPPDFNLINQSNISTYSSYNQQFQSQLISANPSSSIRYPNNDESCSYRQLSGTQTQMLKHEHAADIRPAKPACMYGSNNN